MFQKILKTLKLYEFNFRENYYIIINLNCTPATTKYWLYLDQYYADVVLFKVIANY